MRYLKLFENFNSKDSYWKEHWKDLIKLSEFITDNDDWDKYCNDSNDINYINDSTHKNRALFLLDKLSTEELNSLIDDMKMENIVSDAKNVINNTERQMVDITDYKSDLGIKSDKVIFAFNPKIGEGGNIGKVIIDTTVYNNYEDREKSINGEFVIRFSSIKILDPEQYEHIHHLLGDPQ